MTREQMIDQAVRRAGGSLGSLGSLKRDYELASRFNEAWCRAFNHGQRVCAEFRHIGEAA